MKSMLYVGATLMIGASIYGFVDYKQTRAKKEFREMYSEEKKTQPAVVVAKEEVKMTEPEKTTVVKKRPVTATKKTNVKEKVIDPIQPIAEGDKMVPARTNLAEEPIPAVEPAKESSILKTVKKKKIRKEFFSRGRMPEEAVIEKPIKKESTKTASKEL